MDRDIINLFIDVCVDIFIYWFGWMLFFSLILSLWGSYRADEPKQTNEHMGSKQQNNRIFVEFIICNNGRSKEKKPAKCQKSWDWGLNQPAIGCICVHTYVQYRKLGLEILTSISSSERMCTAPSGPGKGLTPPPKKEKRWTSAHQHPATSLLKILSRYLKPSQSHDDSGELFTFGWDMFLCPHRVGTWAKYNKS